MLRFRLAGNPAACRAAFAPRVSGLVSSRRQIWALKAQNSSESDWSEFGAVLQARIAKAKVEEAIRNVDRSAKLRRPSLPSNTKLQFEIDQDFLVINNWHVEQWEMLRRKVQDDK